MYSPGTYFQKRLTGKAVNKLPLFLLITLTTATFCAGQVNITSNRYDSDRTAANLAETSLTTGNVKSGSFGKLWSYSVDGSIFAQPLYVQQLNIPGSGVHNVLFVATMHDLVYAFDADHAGSPLWTRDFRSNGVTAGVNTYGFILGDQSLGVLSTPVIDLPSNRLFVVAETTENGQNVYRLHSMDIRTGADTISSAIIQASVNGLSIDTVRHIQRVALVVADGQVFVSFSGNPADTTPYHGWILTYDMNTLQKTGAFPVTQSQIGGALWQSGAAPAIDSAGNVYYLTGNGFTDGYDGVSNFSESLVKMSSTNGTLALSDWFTPSHWGFLDAFDLDLSCNAPLLVPGTDLIVFGSKTAKVYVAHRNGLGKMQLNDPQLSQIFDANPISLRSSAKGYPAIETGSVASTASFKNALYAAFQANDSSHTLYVTSAPDGVNFTTPAVSYPGILIGSAPATAAFNNKLYIAFQANDESHRLYVTSSADGVNFTSPATGYPGIEIGGTPAMAVLNNRLYIAFQANDASNTLYITSSADGVNFTTPAPSYPGIQIGSAPALTVFSNALYLAFQANDASRILYVTSSADGVNFTTPAVAYTGIQIGSAPALTALNNRLYLSFRANDNSDNLYLTSSNDGIHFVSPATGYSNIKTGSEPTMSTFNNEVFIPFQSDDASHTLFVATSSDWGNWINGLVYWRRSSSPSLLYAWPSRGPLTSFTFNGTQFDSTHGLTGTINANGEPGVSMVLSANGDESGTGIIWATRTTQGRLIGAQGILHAFDAETLQELWNSSTSSNDSIGALAKFVPPVVANGHVYVASSSNAVQVFGLR